MGGNCPAHGRNRAASASLALARACCWHRVRASSCGDETGALGAPRTAALAAPHGCLPGFRTSRPASNDRAARLFHPQYPQGARRRHARRCRRAIADEHGPVRARARCLRAGDQAGNASYTAVSRRACATTAARSARRISHPLKLIPQEPSPRSPQSASLWRLGDCDLGEPLRQGDQLGRGLVRRRSRRAGNF
jgi:hypothetical protein